MATQGPLNGTDMQVYLDGTGSSGSHGTPLAYATNCSISFSHSPRSTTNSTSGAYATRMAGTIDWEVSVDSLQAMAGMGGGGGGRKWYQMWSSYLDVRAVFFIKWKTEISGDKYMEGYVICTGLSVDNPNQETSTMNVTFAGTGPPSLQTL